MFVHPLRWCVSAPRVLLFPLFALLPAAAAHAADRVPLNLRLPRTAITTQDDALPAVTQRAGTTDAPLSLDDAARIAAARAPQVQANQYRIEAARQDAVRAGRLPDPMLMAGINNLTATGPQAFNAAADDMTMRQLGITQEIPSHTKRAAEKQVAQAGVQLANANEVSLRLATQ